MLTVMLILLLVVLGVNWQTMAFGLLGLARTPHGRTACPPWPGWAPWYSCWSFWPSRAGTGRPISACWRGPLRWCSAATPWANSWMPPPPAPTLTWSAPGWTTRWPTALRDAGVVRTVTRGLGEPKPSLLVSRPTVLLKNFLAGSAAHRTSDKNQQQFSWILGVLRPAELPVHPGLPAGRRHGLYRPGRRLVPGRPAGRHPDLGPACPEDAAQRSPGGARSFPAGRTSASWAASM